MDIAAIIVVAFGVVFVVGGTIVSHYASKACAKEAEENNKIVK